MTKFKSGVNDLRTKRPEIADMWDYERNNIKPEDVYYSSRDKFWFKCCKGHSFSSSSVILYQKRGSRFKGCPVCAGKRIVTGVNDFAHMYPELAKLWDYEKNVLSPDKVNYKERIASFWFICEKGHSFRSIPNNLVGRQKFRTKGCPVCSGRQVIPGVNDIVTLFPERMKEWDYELNYDLDPNYLVGNSTKVMKAVCTKHGCNNVYNVEVQYWIKGTVNHCNEHRLILNGRSFAANDVANLIRSWGILVKEEVHLFQGVNYSFDMFLPSFNIAIEYNGLVWHTEGSVGKEKHKIKYDLCKENGIHLVYLWEDDWLYRNETVRLFLKGILGITSVVKISFDNCVVRSVDSVNAKKFLDYYDIQGFISGDYYLALEYRKKIVAVMVIVKNKDCIEIKRYTSSCNIVDGFIKMLDYAKHFLAVDYFMAYTDNCFLEDKLYKEK